MKEIIKFKSPLNLIISFFISGLFSSQKHIGFLYINSKVAGHISKLRNKGKPYIITFLGY